MGLDGLRHRGAAEGSKGRVAGEPAAARLLSRRATACVQQRVIGEAAESAYAAGAG